MYRKQLNKSDISRCFWWDIFSSTLLRSSVIYGFSLLSKIVVSAVLIVYFNLRLVALGSMFAKTACFLSIE